MSYNYVPGGGNLKIDSTGSILDGNLSTGLKIDSSGSITNMGISTGFNIDSSGSITHQGVLTGLRIDSDYNNQIVGSPAYGFKLPWE
ncbi:MAG: hypothetical protein VSS75_007095 [Candidatus Parabeggiatoa sp.]|nr:hypothetical protein [Candidatus Parabeggiatoa sp.]